MYIFFQALSVDSVPSIQKVSVIATFRHMTSRGWAGPAKHSIGEGWVGGSGTNPQHSIGEGLGGCCPLLFFHIKNNSEINKINIKKVLGTTTPFLSNWDFFFFLLAQIADNSASNFRKKTMLRA